jgi:hypothetical protein
MIDKYGALYEQFNKDAEYLFEVADLFFFFYGVVSCFDFSLMRCPFFIEYLYLTAQFTFSFL